MLWRKIMKSHLIMPMAEAGLRFEREGFKEPKPLIKINGKPFFIGLFDQF
jgi:hypothetical protein